MTHAQEEAQRFNHNYIGTEHLLLGLIREEAGMAAKVLSKLGVELTRVRSAVEFIIGRGERQVPGEIGLTPRAKKVIELAVDEARRLGHHYIDTQHLLLGLIREGEGIAAGVLESLGVNLEKVRAVTLEALDASAESEPEQEAISEERGVFAVEDALRSSVELHPWPLPYAARWEYLVFHLIQEGDATRIQSVNAEAAAPFEPGGTPLHEALRLLGEEGWELVGIDHGPEDAGTLYISKRPKR